MITNVPKTALPHARHSVKDLGRHAGRRVMLCVLAVALFAASGVGFAWHDLQSRINSVDVDDILGGDRPGGDVPDSYEGRAVNLLVLGTDSRSGANNVDNSEGTEEGAGARSDTAMIMHISADRKRIEVVSVPRDTLVDIPECTTLDGETTESSTDTQFNFAFSTGSNGGNETKDVASGAACTQRTVEQMTGIRIDDFVVVDFNGLSTMVDSLGGVKVYVDEPIDDPEYTGLVLDEGCHTMNGATALQYSRVRHGVGNGSDISRIPRQQNLVGAMMRTAQSKNLLTNADQLYTFSASALETLTTSERIGKLQTLMGLASSVQSVGMENISFITNHAPPGGRVGPGSGRAHRGGRCGVEGAAGRQAGGRGLRDLPGRRQRPQPGAHRRRADRVRRAHAGGAHRRGEPGRQRHPQRGRERGRSQGRRHPAVPVSQR